MYDLDILFLTLGTYVHYSCRNLDILGTYVYSTDIFSIASDLHVAMIIAAGEALFSIESSQDCPPGAPPRVTTQYSYRDRGYS